MGGEPTFVSIDDYESAEWNTDAVGPTKRDLADRLIRRLRDRFAPGGFLHYGQGKWYPGESLPRWTFSLYWRRDGKPVWNDAALIAPERQDTNVGAPQAQALLGAIATELGVEQDYVAPAYEDPAEWIIKEGNLPENVTPGELEAEGPGGAATDRPRLCARAHRAVRIRAADPALAGPGERTSLAQREMEDAPRRPLSCAGRQSGRLSPAARRLALRAPGVVPLCRSGRSDRPARAAARFREASARRPGGRVLRCGRVGPGGSGAGRTDARRHQRRGAHRHLGRGARRAPQRVHAAGRAARGLSGADRRGRDGGGKPWAAAAHRGLRAACRPAPQCDPRRAGPGRHRGQHPSGAELARMRGQHAGALRRGAPDAARRRQVHDRRQALGHRRRQPCRGRRGDGARQPVPAPAGSAQKPRHLLAPAAEPQLPVLGAVHRPDQPGAADRRGAPRQPVRARDRARANPEAGRRRRAAAMAHRPADAQHSDRRHRQHAPRRDLHRQALFARRPDRAARARRVPRLRDAAGRRA